MKSNWPTKKLGECLTQFDRGISWSRKDEGGTIAVLRIPNIQEGHINLDDLKHINAQNGNGELQKNDIVMVASNGNPDLVGRSALVTENEEGMRFASFLVRLRFDEKILLSKYAHLFLLTPKFKRELRSKIATTSGIYNLRKQHIEKVKILLPPLKIQKQIVERLDKIAEAQKLNDNLIQKAEELFQSLLHKELNPTGKSWSKKKLREVIDFLKGKKMAVTEEQRPSYEPYIGIDTLRTREYKLYTFEKKGVRCSENDVLVVWDGAYAGTVGIEVSGFAGSTVAKVVIKEPELDSHFLKYFWEFKESKIRSAAQGAAIPHLSKTFVNNLKIPLPPLKIQKQIIAKLSAAQKYKTQLFVQKSKLKELFDSVLSKSFSGK
ncbi:MAG: restriction endonuclease subunit S [Patescibacteria group bacterium]